MTDITSESKAAVEQFLELATRAKDLTKIRNRDEAKGLLEWVSNPESMSALAEQLRGFFQERSQAPESKAEITYYFSLEDPGNGNNDVIELKLPMGTTVAQAIDAVTQALTAKYPKMATQPIDFIRPGNKIMEDKKQLPRLRPGDELADWRTPLDMKAGRGSFHGEFYSYLGTVNREEAGHAYDTVRRYWLPTKPYQLSVPEDFTIKQALQYLSSLKGKTDIKVNGYSLLENYPDLPILETLRNWPDKVTTLEIV